MLVIGTTLNEGLELSSAVGAGDAAASTGKKFLGKIKILHPQKHLISYGYGTSDS